MARLDNRAAGLLALVLGLTALIGFGQGLAQALRAPRPEQVAAGVDPLRDPVPNAAALTGPAMDEAHVRQIAREEASAVLGAARKKAAPAPKADDEDDGDAHPTTPEATPVVPASAGASSPSTPTAPSIPPG